MGLFEFLLLLLIAALCGSIGQRIAGYSMGGCLASIVVGFVGALIGSWIAAKLGLGTIWIIDVGGESIPIIWSIIGAALFSLIVGLIMRGKRKSRN